MIESPIVHQTLIIQKRIAESGFKMSDLTYVEITKFIDTRPQKKGKIRVKGSIDSFQLKQYNLLPSQAGTMILPINLACRKKTGKKVGDKVEVILFLDESPLKIPEYFELSLMESNKAKSFFDSLSESNQKYYIDWVESAQNIETKTNRLLKTIEKLENGIKFYDW